MITEASLNERHRVLKVGRDSVRQRFCVGCHRTLPFGSAVMHGGLQHPAFLVCRPCQQIVRQFLLKWRKPPRYAVIQMLRRAIAERN